MLPKRWRRANPGCFLQDLINQSLALQNWDLDPTSSEAPKSEWIETKVSSLLRFARKQVKL